MDETRKSGPSGEGAGESPRPSARAKAAAWARDVLGNDFTAVRVELLRHLEYDEKNPRFAEYDGLVTLHRKGRLDDAGLRRLKELGPTVPLDTGSYPDAYGDVRDAILRGDAIPFADAGAFDESAASPEAAGAADRIRRSFPTLLGGRTATVTSDVREALGKILGGAAGPKEIPVVKVRLPGSGKENAVGQARAECSTELWRAIKESVLPNGRDTRHAVIVANRSYSDAFTGLTDEPDLGVDANEARFTRRGRLIADLSHGENAMKMPRVQDCARFGGRAEARAAFDAAGGALAKAMTRRAEKPEAKMGGFPEGIEAELDDMGVVELQNLANALLREDPELAKSLAGCGVPELDLMALRAAMGVRPFAGTEFSGDAAIGAFAALMNGPRGGDAVSIAEAAGEKTTAALVSRIENIVLATGECAYRESAKSFAQAGKRGLAVRISAAIEKAFAVLGDAEKTLSPIRKAFGKSPDPRMNQEDEEGRCEGWRFQTKFRISIKGTAPDRKALSDISDGKGLLEEIVLAPGLYVVESEGGSGKSLLLAKTAQAWIESGYGRTIPRPTEASSGAALRLSYVDLHGKNAMDREEGTNARAIIEKSAKDCGIVLLDSLDEANWGVDKPRNGKKTPTLEECRGDFANFIEGVAKGGATVVMTTRPGHLPTAKGKRLLLEPFEQEGADGYVAQYFHKHPQEREILGDWERTCDHGGAEFRAAAFHPLTLALMCEAVAKDPEKEEKRERFVDLINPAKLFEKVARLRLDRWENTNDKSREAELEKEARTEAYLDAMGQLAFLMTNGRKITANNARNHLPNECIKHLRNSSAAHGTPLLNPLSMIVAPDGEDGEISFTHDAFREYFNLRHLRKLIDDGQEVPLGLVLGGCRYDENRFAIFAKSVGAKNGATNNANETAFRNWLKDEGVMGDCDAANGWPAARVSVADIFSAWVPGWETRRAEKGENARDQDPDSTQMFAFASSPATAAKVVNYFLDNGKPEARYLAAAVKTNPELAASALAACNKKNYLQDDFDDRVAHVEAWNFVQLINTALDAQPDLAGTAWAMADEMRGDMGYDTHKVRYAALSADKNFATRWADGEVPISHLSRDHGSLTNDMFLTVADAHAALAERMFWSALKNRADIRRLIFILIANVRHDASRARWALERLEYAWANQLLAKTGPQKPEMMVTMAWASELIGKIVAAEPSLARPALELLHKYVDAQGLTTASCGVSSNKDARPLLKVPSFSDSIINNLKTVVQADPPLAKEAILAASRLRLDHERLLSLTSFCASKGEPGLASEAVIELGAGAYGELYPMALLATGKTAEEALFAAGTPQRNEKTFYRLLVAIARSGRPDLALETFWEADPRKLDADFGTLSTGLERAMAEKRLKESYVIELRHRQTLPEIFTELIGADRTDLLLAALQHPGRFRNGDGEIVISTAKSIVESEPRLAQEVFNALKKIGYFDWESGIEKVPDDILPPELVKSELEWAISVKSVRKRASLLTAIIKSDPSLAPRAFDAVVEIFKSTDGNCDIMAPLLTLAATSRNMKEKALNAVIQSAQDAKGARRYATGAWRDGDDVCRTILSLAADDKDLTNRVIASLPNWKIPPDFGRILDAVMETDIRFAEKVFEVAVDLGTNETELEMLLERFQRRGNAYRGMASE